MVSRRAQGSHCSSLTGWLLRLFGRLSLILFVPIANAGYNLQSNGVTLTQDASDTTSPYNYTITFTINNVTGGKNQNDGIESMQLVLDDGSSYCNSGISIAPADVNTSTTYGPFNATAFTNNSSDASLPAGSTHPFSWYSLPTTIVVRKKLLQTTSRSRLQHPIALQLLSMTPARLMRTVRSMLRQAACSAMTQMLMRTHFRSPLSELEQKLDLGLQARYPRRSQAPMVT